MDRWVTVIVFIVVFICVYTWHRLEYACVKNYYPEMNFSEYVFLSDKIRIIPE